MASQEKDTIPLLTLFITKEKFFKNSKRVILLTDKAIISLETETLKRATPYRNILALGPGQKINQFILKTPELAETYLTEIPPEKDTCLTILYEFKKAATRKADERKRVKLLQKKAYSDDLEETAIELCSVSFAKLDMNNEERIYSSKYIKDIESLYSFKDENDSIAILFTDKSKSYYKVTEMQTGNFIKLMQGYLKKYYNKDVAVKSANVSEIIPAPVELAPNDRIFGFPIKKYSKKLNYTENRIFCITLSSICICESARVLSVHPITQLKRITIFEDDPTRFEIEYNNSTKSAPSTYYCDERDIIIANLMSTTGIYQNDSPIFDLSGVRFHYYLRGSCEFRTDPEMEEYYLRRLARLTLSTPNLVQGLKEFNENIPMSYPFQTKDRRGLVHIIEMLQVALAQFEKGQPGLASTIIELLQVVQRLLSSRLYFSDIKQIKNVQTLFSDLIRSNEDRLVSAGALTLLRLIEQPKVFQGKEQKLEALNKSFFCSAEDKTSPIMTSLLATLIQRSDEIFGNREKKHTLTVSCLLEILVSLLSTHANTTEKSWFRDVIPKLSRGRVLTTLFELCKSPCFSIALKATEIVKVIFTRTKSDQIIQLQDQARQQLALLFQIYQAVDCRLQKQRGLSSELAGLMAEGNEDSMRLIYRIFPLGLLSLLDVQDPKPRRLLGRGDSKATGVTREGPSDSPNQPQQKLNQTKLNWENLFKGISSEINSPVILWNADTRKEVVTCIGEEIASFESGKDNNKDTNKVWNHEEFVVDYPTLNKQLIVDNYYLGIILEQPDKLSLPDPVGFINHCFHKLLLESSSMDRYRYLKVMSWCFMKYNQQINGLSFISNLVFVLDNYIKEKKIMESTALLEFFVTSFKSPLNARYFIDANGTTVAAQIIEHSHNPEYTDSVIICLHVLLHATKFIKSTDERGLIKIPIPKAKRDLGQPIILTNLVRALLSPFDLVVENAARLLTEILDKNSTKARYLHKQTGILYFIFIYQKAAAAGSLVKLLQTLVPQQDPHLLRKFIPDSLSSYLLQTDEDSFANVFLCTTSAPEVIWTKQMRDILVKAIENHISSYLTALKSNYYANYEYQELESVEYPGLSDELRCGEYYVRNIIESPEWNIDCPEDVLNDALKIIQTVDKSKQILLLRVCSILFKKKRARARSAFNNFEGFPIVLKYLHLDRHRPDLSQENIELLFVAAELVLYSVWTSNENLTNFLKLKGLSSLCNLLWCCSKSRECDAILVYVLKIVCRLLPSQLAREQISMNIDVIRDTLSCLTVGQSQDVVHLAMQCLMEFVRDSLTADAVYKMGGHFYLLDFIISYTPGADHSVTILNQLSASACLVLGNISGVFKADHEPLTAFEQQLQKALASLLTKGMLERLKDTTELQFIEGLCQTYETPVTIWNESTRNELAHFIKDRIEKHQNTNYVEGELNFTFKAHQAEVQIDGIFLRIYLQQPQYKLNNSISFISELLNDLGINSNNIERSSLVLRCLYNVLTVTQGNERMVVTQDALDLFFRILSSAHNQLFPFVLSIFLHATTDQSCVDAVCSPTKLHEFFLFIKKNRGNNEQIRILLDVVSNMVSSSQKAVSGITTSGIILYLLDYLISPDNQDEQLQSQSLAILKQIKSSSSGKESKFFDATSLFLPRYLIALVDRPADFLFILKQSNQMPDLIWNSENRAVSSKAIAETLSQYEARNEIEWDYKQCRSIDFAQLNKQTVIGGVYIQIYVDQPKIRLYNPMQFIDAAINELPNCRDELIRSQIITSLFNLVNNHAHWAHYFGDQQTQALGFYLNLLGDSSLSIELIANLLSTIAVLAHSASCRKKFLSTNVIECLLKALEYPNIPPNLEELALKTVHLLIKVDPTFAKQLANPKSVNQLFAVSEKKGAAALYGFSILKFLSSDKRSLDPQVGQILNSKDQLLSAQKLKQVKPDWLQVPTLSANLKNPYVAPMAADASAIKLAAMRNTSSAANIVAPPSPQQTQAPRPIAPLVRQNTQPQTISQQTPQEPVAKPTGPPAPPTKPIELRTGDFDEVLPPAVIEESLPIAAIPPPPATVPPPPPPPVGGPPPPPPPPPPMAPPAIIPAAASNNSEKSGSQPKVPPAPAGDRGNLLAAIRAGSQLKHVKTPTPEERKAALNTAVANPSPNNRPAVGPAAGSGAPNLMNALATALAARRTSMITNLAANPFADEDGEEGEEEWGA